MNAAERKRAQRQRDRLAGWVEVTLKVAAGRVEELRDFAASLPPPEGTRALAERFARSGVAPEPYGLAADPSGALVGRLTAATADAPPPSPDALLTPGDWAALREICAQ